MRKRSGGGGGKKQNRDRSLHCGAAASAHARVAILKKLLCQTCRVAVERKHCVSKHQRRRRRRRRPQRKQFDREGAAKWRGEVSGLWMDGRMDARNEIMLDVAITQHYLEGGDYHELLRRLCSTGICPSLFASEAIFSLF